MNKTPKNSFTNDRLPDEHAMADTLVVLSEFVDSLQQAGNLHISILSNVEDQTTYERECFDSIGVVNDITSRGFASERMI